MGTIENKTDDQHLVAVRNGPLRQLRWYLATLIGSSPSIYVPLRCWGATDFEGRPRALNRSTELVIDAYPRSANTFATVAFQLAQNREVALAHHFHAPAVIRYAVKHRIPILTIVRDPDPACVSSVLLSSTTNLTREFKKYRRYYETVCRHRFDIIVARFDSVISNFGEVIERVNGKFDTRFCTFQHTPGNVQKVRDQLNARQLRRYGELMDRQGKGTAPSAARDSLKQRIAARIECSELRDIRHRAKQLFEQLWREADI